MLKFNLIGLSNPQLGGRCVSGPIFLFFFRSVLVRTNSVPKCFFFFRSFFGMVNDEQCEGSLGWAGQTHCTTYMDMRNHDQTLRRGGGAHKIFRIEKWQSIGSLRTSNTYYSNFTFFYCYFAIDYQYQKYPNGKSSEHLSLRQGPSQFRESI